MCFRTLLFIDLQRFSQKNSSTYDLKPLSKAQLVWYGNNVRRINDSLLSQFSAHLLTIYALHSLCKYLIDNFMKENDDSLYKHPTSV